MTQATPAHRTPAPCLTPARRGHGTLERQTTFRGQLLDPQMTPDAMAGSDRRLSLHSIFYSKNTIRDEFEDGTPLELGSVQPDWRLHVVRHRGSWHSLNNRLLFVLRTQPGVRGDTIVDVKVLPYNQDDLRWKFSRLQTGGNQIQVENSERKDTVSRGIFHRARRFLLSGIHGLTPTFNETAMTIMVHIAAMGLFVFIIGLLCFTYLEAYRDTKHNATISLFMLNASIVLAFGAFVYAR
ncbi:hypothetical protein CYMTET_54693 [Cymbomonas tetramitiformis]|uniref:Uncharacterized protein n=1 Tax=Cymbomonas tetramitiformis TaxID=36881 RepID=A0AAE0ENR6_9CHLO|nr:hypothetical protein CYMTET_54693 [Cymbomonas tetramitiformis]